MMNPNNPHIPNRGSIRLKGYDYSQSGAYFITICAHNRESLFGEIENGEMKKKEYGQIVINEWMKTTELRHEIELGEYVIMPNHFHGILIMHHANSSHRRGTASRALMDRRAPTHHAPTIEQFGKPVAGSLPTIMRSFKSAVTKNINDVRNSSGMQVWQRNYYEHVIRNDDDYNRIAEYVANNPRRWNEDTLHPDNQPSNMVAACKGTARFKDTARYKGTARRAPTRVTRPGDVSIKGRPS